MNVRQIAVINLAKFNKLVKELTYNVCIMGDASLNEFAMDLLEYEEWVTTIRDYAVTTQSPRYMEEIYKLGKPKLLEDYVFECRGKIPENQQRVLDKIIDYLNLLCGIYQEYDKEVKGDFNPLVSTLANKDAVALLNRAVKAGYLDEVYQPKSLTDRHMLKIIAYAIIQMLNLPPGNTWSTFEEQWHFQKDEKLVAIVSSTVQQELSQPIMALYPEVDFTPLFSPKDVYLTNKYGTDRVKALFYDLRRSGYIAKETKIDEFQSIFKLGKLKERVPVNWILEQRLLVYFAYFAFSHSEKDIWVKVRSCFRVNGNTINVGSLKSCIVNLKNKDNFLTIDPKLRKIASDYINGR